MLSMKIIKRISATVLVTISVMSLQACSLNSQSVNVPEYVEISNGFIDEAVLHKSDKEGADKVRSAMTKMLSNEYAELYVGESYDIALIDKRTEKVWYSNEAIYDEAAENYSEEQKKYAYSQLIVDYYRSDNVSATVTSYPECYDGDQKNQVTTEVKDDVLSVKYSFGTDMNSRVIFQVISAETYVEMEKKIEKAVEDGEVSKSGWGRMKSSYNQSEDGTYYVLNPSVTYIQTDNIEEVCKQLGYTREDVDAEEEKIGISAELEAAVPNFVITINYILDGADLLTTVEISNIHEPSDFYLNRVSVLPGFGANMSKDEGYMILSEGGGSLIYNDSSPTKGAEMTTVFYGDDAAEKRDTISDLSANSVFPIFGIKSGDTAVLAIVESGDAISGVDILRANQTYVRNMAAPWFNYRVRGAVSAGENTDDANYVYSECITKQPYVVRYHLLYDDRATYDGMADYYRSYLLATGNLVAAGGGSRWYEDVSVVGALSGEKTIAGVSVEAALAVSDYASVEQWISETGLEQLSINYEGVFNGGVDGKAPLKLKAESSLGTNEECKEIFGQDFVYPALSIQTVSENGNGIKSNKDIAKSINKEYASCASYNLATGQIKDEKRRFLITPVSYEKITSGLITAYESYNNNILIKNAASLLYSDFNVNRSVSREESKILLCDALQQLKDTGLSMKIEGVNAYALKYGSAFTNVTTDSIKTGFMDYKIPFVGMVLHGVVPYSVAPLNEASNYEDALLDMIECGANPHWRLVTGDMSVLLDTEYTCYFSASADYWTDEIKSLEKELQGFYTAVSEETIVDHSVLENGLVRVTYSNGYKAYVNRTNETLIDGDISVERHSFYLCSEKGGK